MKTNRLDPEHIIASIPDENIFMYYDHCLEEDVYQGVYLKSDSYTCFFDWEFNADMYHIPELTLLNNKSHLLITFDKEDGGIYILEAHIVDLQTMKEIFIQSPNEILKENITVHDINYDTGEISFTYFGKEIFEDTEPQYLCPEIYSSIAYEEFYYFEVVNDSLSYTTFLVVSPSYSIGRIKINYIFKENRYQMDFWEYESHVR